MHVRQEMCVHSCKEEEEQEEKEKESVEEEEEEAYALFNDTVDK